MDRVSSFMDLFEGLDRAYGTYETKSHRADNKLTGRATTLTKNVTRDIWESHLNGKQGLGIIPINDESCTKFGAIDIDMYDGLSHAGLVKLLKSSNLPFVVCRSKSGGAHIYAFVDSWIPASLMQSKLKEIAAALGYGACEIFPKQTEILAERGDIGQWINMPYFGSDNTTRYGFNDEGKQLDIDGFIEYALKQRVSPDEFESLSIEVVDDIKDGPPCLQHLVTQGFPEGTRNDGLFNIGVYLRKKDPDGWERKIDEANSKYMIPPLTSEEVNGVKKSLRKKEFNFTCSKPPIVSHCNSAVCRLRKYGIGSSSSMPVMTSLTKFNSNPPIWFVDVEGSGRLELSTEELQNQTKFQKRCMEALNIMPLPVSKQAWCQMINHLMDNATVIEAPADASTEGQFMEHVYAFCTGKARARNKSEILLGKPWLDETINMVCFRTRDLIAYLDRHHFREFKPHKIAAILRDRGLEHKFINVNGTGTNIWMLKLEDREEELEVPKEVKDDKPNY